MLTCVSIHGVIFQTLLRLYINIIIQQEMVVDNDAVHNFHHPYTKESKKIPFSRISRQYVLGSLRLPFVVIFLTRKKIESLGFFRVWNLQVWIFHPCFTQLGLVSPFLTHERVCRVESTPPLSGPFLSFFWYKYGIVNDNITSVSSRMLYQL